MGFTAIIATALSSVLWSLFDFSRKKLAGNLAPIPVVIWLMLLQTPIFLLFLINEQWTLPPSSYWLPALASLLLNSLANVSFIFALRMAPLSLAVPMLSLGPVFSSIAGFVLLGESTSGRQICGIAVIVLSAFALGRSGARRESSSQNVSRGLLLMAMVAAFWSTTPALDKMCLQSVAPSEHAFLQCLAVAASLVLWLRLRLRRGSRGGAMDDAQKISFSQVQTSARWFAVAVIVASGALLSQFWAIQLVSVGMFEALKRAIGMVVALLLGVFILKESVTRGKVLAIAAMAGGVFILLM
jgi:drug/metabolite transporter (DMT)-like permease